MANNKKKKGLKLSEAVEMGVADVLPEAKLEDFEITTVAAVSEPFADARARNKVAREKFKQMIDAQTEQAKKALKLDDQLKERQANGNGKLVEAFVDEETETEITKAFEAAKTATVDYADKALGDELNSRDLHDSRLFFAAKNYIKVTNFLNLRIKEAFENARKQYISMLVEAVNESKKASVKISLDEGLFESVEEEKKPLTEGKKFKEARIISDAKNYKPWIGAVPVFEKIKEAGKLEDFYALLDDAYPSGIDEQALNDLLWFDSDWIYEMLGMEVEE